MCYAQLAAGTALIGGQKSVEVAHAYILLAFYPVPSRRWEYDRSYFGVAIRSAHPLSSVSLAYQPFHPQHRHRSQPAPPEHREATERAARMQNAEPHLRMAELFQPQLLDGLAVRQDVNHRQPRLHSEPVRLLEEYLTVQYRPVRPGSVPHEDLQRLCALDRTDQEFGRQGAGVGDGRPAGEAVGDVDCAHMEAC